MKFVIINKQFRPLSYFFPNGNDRVRDIIGFSNYNFIPFYNIKEAENWIKFMKSKIREREMEVRCWLKICKLIDNLKIVERS